VSNIFDILHRGKGDIADIIRPLVAAQTEAQPHASTEPKSGDSPQAPAQPTRQAPTDNAPALTGFRTLSVRIPAPSPLLPFDDGQWRPSEQYRILRTKINQHPKKPQVIVVSSPAPGDGKSVTAVNTAAVLSLKKEGRVLLLDADLRKSAIHVQLGIPQSPGLADVLTGNCTLDDAIVRIQEFPNLFVLAAGTASGNPAELLDSAAWQGLCEKLRSLFRFVVMDSPPVGAVADYDLIQAVCDGVILVIRPDHTNRQLCQKSLEHLPKAKFLGVLLNCVPDWAPAKGAGSDYYYYSGSKVYSNRGAAS
jgi:capsular exopolysaccharide synthesis family protein